MTESELKKYFDIYTDIWKFFRKYSSPTSNEIFWGNLVNETYELYEKHGKTTFVGDLLRKTIDEIERIYKRGTFNEET